jgi:hypothetical protein
MPIPWIITASHSNWVVELIFGIRKVWIMTGHDGVYSGPFRYSQYIDSGLDDDSDGFEGQ